MELRQLEHFLVVAEEGNFTRAAALVHMSQSALSSSIRSLERQLSAELFERTTRRVLLTDAGVALRDHARRIIGEVAAARLAVESITGVDAGTIDIGTVQTFTAIDLPATMALFHRHHPMVQMRLREATTTQLIEALVEGELDLAFVALDATPLHTSLTEVARYDESLIAIAGPDHPISVKRRVGLGELAEHGFIDFEAGPGLQTVVADLFSGAHVQREITCRVGDMGRLVDLVRHGLGVAVVPAPVAHAANGVVAVPLDTTPPATRSLALLSRTGGPSNPAAKRFLGLLDHPR
ncbi:LysR substrate-binding domain-containing protein [Gordonia westfalica]|uniref:LysR substrate-binding domain-containing protein n=1 Tax=Gordonia westfalica TaxID=158898 RepID=A0ABU2GUC0_9ACTN|nr:LysR substrate-binding domain-containing protein [Gordonia westfalica]MDS1115056.1 LysR substrate-binding domain-containing protein [Gordonia westfalica]